MRLMPTEAVERAAARDVRRRFPAKREVSLDSTPLSAALPLVQVAFVVAFGRNLTRALTFLSWAHRSGRSTAWSSSFR